MLSLLHYRRNNTVAARALRHGLCELRRGEHRALFLGPAHLAHLPALTLKALLAQSSSLYAMRKRATRLEHKQPQRLRSAFARRTYGRARILASVADIVSEA